MIKTSLITFLSLTAFINPLLARPDFNDLYLKRQWGLYNSGQEISRRSDELSMESIVGIPGNDINWVDVNEIDKNIPEDREVIVAVLDTGVDVNHPDLKGRIAFDKKLCPAGEDNSKKPCSGMNILERNLNLTDDDGHGTHVSGIIAAMANNGEGVSGLADSRIKILPVKVLSKDVQGFVYKNRVITDTFADGIAYAIERGATVINLSIGWPKVVESPRIRNVFKFAEENNITIVAAAGNNNKQVPTFPCTNEFVICVGAIDNQGKITEFSNYGGKVDILAPGESILSTYPQDSVESRVLRVNGYELKNGTSQASPYVTGIVASMKLLYPGITNKEIRARLFSSAKSVDGPRFQGKFSKNGLVDMKEALSQSLSFYAEPQFKNLLDITYSQADQSFSFDLPIRSEIGEVEELKVEVAIEKTKGDKETKDILLNTKEFKVALADGESKNLNISGKLLSTQGDSQVRLIVKLKSETFSKDFETTIIFSRDLTGDSSLIKESIKGFSPSAFQKENLRKVLSKEVLSEPSFYILDPQKQSEEETLLSVMFRKDSEWLRRNISLKKKHEILSVHEMDADRSGSLDLLVVGVNKDQNMITYDYILNAENDDVTYSIGFPLLDYSRFPVKVSEFEKFSFRTIKFKDGLLKVPSFFGVYILPEKDNTQDILDRIPEDALMTHLYYFNPIEKEGDLVFDLRVVDSYAITQKLRNELDVPAYLPLGIDAPAPQSSVDSKLGQLRGILHVGEEFERSYYKYLVTSEGVEVEPLFTPERLIAGNNVRALQSLATESLGLATTKVEYLAQLNRYTVRSYVIAGNNGEEVILKGSGYSDPIFKDIASFDDKNLTRLVETRYFIKFQDQAGNEGSLRINRDSSFPGVQFSESLKAISVRAFGENRPGVFINSTLIFGRRLYTMAKIGDEFIRPVEFSVDIPANCVHMNPEIIEGVTNYLMLCRKGPASVEMARLPLILE